MASDFQQHLETGRRILERMAKSPCEYIETAFEAEKHALEETGAERAALRAAVQDLDGADRWTDVQREAFVAYVTYLDEHLD